MCPTHPYLVNRHKIIKFTFKCKPSFSGLGNPLKKMVEGRGGILFIYLGQLFKIGGNFAYQGTFGSALTTETFLTAMTKGGDVLFGI